MNRLSQLLQSLPPPARNWVIIGGALILSALFLMLFGWLFLEVGVWLINTLFWFQLDALGYMVSAIVLSDLTVIIVWLGLAYLLLRIARRRGTIQGMDWLLWRPRLPTRTPSIPAPLQASGTIPIALLDNDGKLAFRTAFGGLGDGNVLPLRDVPKGAKLVAVNDRESITVELPTAIRYWWTFPYLAAPLLCVFVFLPVGGTIGVYFALQANAVLGLIWPVLGGAVAILAGVMTYFGLRRLTHPKTLFHITQEAVQVGKIVIPRDEHFGGLWSGGEQMMQRKPEEQSMHPVKGFKDDGMFWTPLRVTYGRWGEPLPYMLPKDEANDYILWIAEILEWVSPPEERANIPEAGIRAQSF